MPMYNSGGDGLAPLSRSQSCYGGSSSDRKAWPVLVEARPLPGPSWPFRAIY